MKNFLLLTISMFFTIGLFAQCTDLFISEYIEGSTFNKALEIYNPTDAAIDLSTYRVVRWRNGSNVFDSANSVSLSGTVGAKDVFVAVKEAGTQQDGTPEEVSADLEALADGFFSPSYNISSAFYFNGDDALSLEKFEGGQWVVVDLFATTANGDPGSGWTDVAPYLTNFSNDSWTTDQSLVRKASVQTGVTATNNGSILTNVPMEFNPSIEWDSLPENTFANLGMHDCACNTSSTIEFNQVDLSIYPNPVNSSNKSIQIEAGAAILEISIVNMLGQTVSHEVFDGFSKEMTYELNSNLETGIYLLKVDFGNNQQSVEKLILR